MDNQRALETGQPLRLGCPLCHHEWDMPWERGMLVESLLLRVEAYCICPRCGNKSKARGKGIVILPSGDAAGGV